MDEHVDIDPHRKQHSAIKNIYFAWWCLDESKQVAIAQKEKHMYAPVSMVSLRVTIIVTTNIYYT
jgi:hypothetical protein